MAQQTIPSQAVVGRDGPTIERRAWVRIPSDQEAFCHPLAARNTDPTETGWLGKVRDVSAGGIALIVRRRFEPGTMLMIDLEQGPRQLAVRVVRATREINGRWVIGCTFAGALSQEELEGFLTIPGRPLVDATPTRLQLPTNC